MNIKEQICELLNVSPDSIEYDTPLENIVNDSFMLVELTIALQEELGIRLDYQDLTHIKTVGEFISLVSQRLKAA